ncbi:MAG TPA: RNA polymerase sigma factor [Candidatus Limnocylindrales bacterium]
MQVALVERAQGGDQEAFAALATASVDRCYAIAYRILRDMHRAQDATQQALLSAWRDLPTLRDPERFDAWLHRLVVRACYAEVARDRRWGTGVRLIPSDRSTVPDSASSIADRDELERGFRRLSPEQRAVLVLHHYLGYPLTEIAETLGIPVGTARSRLHYATRQLRAAIEADARPTTPKERTA